MTAAAWQSYIPYHLAREVAQDPSGSSHGQEQRLEAIALFADISGFTALSERLGRKGKQGAEELTTLLNHYFEPMIAMIHSYGGIIGKFGGDAITVFFPAEGEGVRPTVRRATQCALDIQAQMIGHATVHIGEDAFHLSVKIGVAWGKLLCMTIGNRTLRCEPIIAGSTLDRCAEAEYHARPGEVMLPRNLAHAGDIEWTEHRGEFAVVRRVAGHVEAAPLPPLPPLSNDSIAIIAPYLHPVIVERIRHEQHRFINEHRHATILFVNFSGFDYDEDPTIGSKLRSYFSEVFRIVQHYDGYLNKVDMGDKGSKYIILFGAPVAHEDDVERALRCALDLRALQDVEVRIGINGGFVFCGQVGSSLRQEYTVMGDAVNLAARLMQHAQPGQILVHERLRGNSRHSFKWNETQQLQVKGKSQPILVSALEAVIEHSLHHPVDNSDNLLPMVGRETEKRLIIQALVRASSGHGQLLGVTAEAGMGKSRLANEIIPRSTDYGFASHVGECLSHGRNSSYLVWQRILRELFGLNPERSIAEQLEQLKRELAQIDGSLVQRMPLLALPLNLPIPETPLTQTLDAKTRKELLEALVVACIRHFTKRTPRLIVLENCHWLDSLSNDLLEAVGRGSVDIPLLLLVIYRPPGDDLVQPRIRRFRHFKEIVLTEFTNVDTAQLIQLKLVHQFGITKKVSEKVADVLNERAQGNPFYVDELLNLMHDRNIDPTDVQNLHQLELPSNLQTLIISRIDRLEEASKLTLKVASVIGQLFKASWLWHVYPKLGAPREVIAQLELLHQLELTLRQRREPELEHLFKHILTREVAYESLAHSTRITLHERVAHHIEQKYPDSLDQQVDLLAYHYSISQNRAKQREYLWKAALAAQAAYANEAAIQYYQQLLPLLETEQQDEVRLKLGEVLQLVGRWSEAEAHYERALEIARQGRDQERVAQCQLAIGVLLRLRGHHAEALQSFEEARANFESTGSQRDAINTQIEIGIVYYALLGEFDRALDAFEKCRREASRLEDQLLTLRALGNIGAIYGMQGDYENALGYYEAGHRLAVELDDPLKASIAIGGKGAVHWLRGERVQALESYFKQLRIASDLGYRRGIIISLGNIGELYLEQGEFQQALLSLLTKLHLSLEIGDRPEVASALWYIVRIFMYEQHYDKVIPLLKRAIAISRALSASYDLCEYLNGYASVLVAQGENALAQQINHEALSLAQGVDHNEVQVQATVRALQLRVRLEQVQEEEVILEWQQQIVDAGDKPELAALHYEIWRLDPAQEAHREQAAGLYRTLYEQMPNVLYKQRYERLTGDALPAPPPLPPLPDVVTRDPVSLDELLPQVDTLIEELKRESAAEER